MAYGAYGAYGVSNVFSDIHSLSFKQNAQKTQGKEISTTNVLEQFKPLEKDVFSLSTETPQKAQAPKIGLARILFNRLTKEQLAAVNDSRELPKNAKFIELMNGKIGITWNALDWTTGTHTLPAGYEVKNDILGFTHVVREGTKNIFIK